MEYVAGGYTLSVGEGRRVLASGEQGQHGDFRARSSASGAFTRRSSSRASGGTSSSRGGPIRSAGRRLPGGAAAGDELHGRLTAPMPGKVIALLARPGEKVEKGAPLLVLEAMKMEHTIKAPRAGVVKAFRFAPGEQVSEGAELVEIE